MYGIVKIGAYDIPLEANASTPIRYKQLFHRNLLPFFMGQTSEEENGEMLPEMAYVMAMSAAREDMNRLTYDGYISWLEKFDALDFYDSTTVTKIRDIYMGNAIGESEVKKNQDQASE